MSTMRNSVMMVGRPTRPTMDTEILVLDIFLIDKTKEDRP